MKHALRKRDREFWSPFSGLSRLEDEFDRLFSHTGFFEPQFPAVNVEKNENEIRVSAELPGYDPEQIDISVEGQVLTLSGSVESDEETKEADWLIRERRTGSFRRMIGLPWAVEADKVKAAYKKGVLHVTLPRAEKERPLRISVDAEQ